MSALPIEDIGRDPMLRLTRDLKQAATLLTPSEARYLVDLYYTIQDQRIAPVLEHAHHGNPEDAITVRDGRSLDAAPVHRELVTECDVLQHELRAVFRCELEQADDFGGVRHRPIIVKHRLDAQQAWR